MLYLKRLGIDLKNVWFQAGYKSEKNVQFWSGLGRDHLVLVQFQ